MQLRGASCILKTKKASLYLSSFFHVSNTQKIMVSQQLHRFFDSLWNIFEILPIYYLCTLRTWIPKFPLHDILDIFSKWGWSHSIISLKMAFALTFNNSREVKTVSRNFSSTCFSLPMACDQIIYFWRKLCAIFATLHLSIQRKRTDANAFLFFSLKRDPP